MKLYVSLWVAVLATVTGLSRTACALQGSEDFAQFILNLWAPTAFYPGSNRLGALLPLMTLGIRDIVWNANAQMVLRALSAYGAALACARILSVTGAALGGIGCAALGFLVSLLVFWQFSPAAFYVSWVSAHTEMIAAAILLVALSLPRKLNLHTGARRWSLLFWCGAGSAVAFWVNLSLFPIAVVVILSVAIQVLCRVWSRLRRTGGFRRSVMTLSGRPIVTLIIMAGMSTTGFVLSTTAAGWYSQQYPDLTRSFSSETYTRIAFQSAAIGIAGRNLIAETGGTLFVLQAGMCTVIAAVRVWKHAHLRSTAFRPITRPQTEIAILIGAISHFVLVSQSSHVQAYSLHFRYFLVPAMAIVFLFASYCYAFALWSVRALHLKYGQARAVVAVLGLVILPSSILGSVALRHQLPSGLCFVPSLQGPADSIAQMGASGAYVGVLGSYWDVWPAVFRTAVAAQGRDDSTGRLLPTGYRSELLTKEMHGRIRREVLKSGVARFLCLPPGPSGTDVFGLDCAGLLKWNNNWGTIPGFGRLPEISAALPGGVHDVMLKPAILNIDEEVRFAAGGNGSGYQFSGWSQPEGFGSWTLGRRAELVFGIERMPTDDTILRIDIVTDIGKFVVPARFGAVEISLNDEHLTRWTFNPDSGDRSLQLRRHMLHVGGNVLTFDIVEPHSGADLGFSPTDRRPLGFAIRSMRWMRSGQGAISAELYR